MINFCMVAKEYEKTRDVSTAMILVCIFQFIYVADCLFYEVSEYVSSIQQNPSRVYKFLKPTQGVILTPASLGISFSKVALLIHVHELDILF